MDVDLIKEFISEFLPNNRFYKSDIFYSVVSRLYYPKKISGIENITNNVKGRECFEKIFSSLSISANIISGELPEKPIDQPLVIVMNHPMGMTDLVVAMYVASKYEDLKVLGAKIYELFDPDKEFIIPVDMNKVGGASSPRKSAINHLANNNTLMLAPSGAVSKPISAKIQDPMWVDSFVTLASQSGAKVLPIKNDGRNSMLYYVAACFLSARTAAFFHGAEMVRQANSTIDIKIGNLIDVDQLLGAGFTETEVAKQIREVVYSM